MNLFVTGASGFIGKNFCKKALKAGHKIFAPTRKKKFSFTHRNMIWLKGEFFYNWKKSLSHSHMLVHFAASGVKSDYENDIYDLNIFQSLKLFKNGGSPPVPPFWEPNENPGKIGGLKIRQSAHSWLNHRGQTRLH